MTYTSAVGILLTAIVLAACADNAGSGAATLVRDSAGVAIVHSTAPAHGADAWTLSEEPIFQVGDVDGAVEYWFGALMGMTRLSDGTVVAADMQRNRLAFYGPDGRFIRAVGRAGEGPGEYRQIMQLQRLPGDSLLVQDFNGFAQIFDSQGNFVRRISLLPEGGGTTIMGGFQLVGPFGDGTFAAGRGFPIGPDGPPDSAKIYRLAADGSVHDSIFTYPTNIPMGTRGPVQAVFSARDQSAARHGRFYRAYAGRYRVEIRNPEGQLERVFTRDWTPSEVKPDELQAYRNSFIGMGGEDGRSVPQRLRDQRARILDESPVADHHPAFLRMLVDEVGNVWLQEPTLEHQLPGAGGFQPTVAAPSRWNVFGADGTWLTDITTPADFRVFEIGDDYVLGLSRGDAGVEQVRIYSLRKR